MRQTSKIRPSAYSNTVDTPFRPNDLPTGILMRNDRPEYGAAYRRAAASATGSHVMRGQRIELRIGGTGGQGLILSAKMLADALAACGKHVAQAQSYEPTSRGGFCSADLVVADGEVDFPLATALDCLVLLDRMAVTPSWPLLKPGALVIADTRLCPELPAGDYRRPSLAAQPHRAAARQRAGDQHRRARRLGRAERNLRSQPDRAGGARGNAARLPRSQHGCAQGGLFAAHDSGRSRRNSRGRRRVTRRVLAAGKVLCLDWGCGYAGKQATAGTHRLDLLLPMRSGAGPFDRAPAGRGRDRDQSEFQSRGDSSRRRQGLRQGLRAGAESLQPEPRALSDEAHQPEEGSPRGPGLRAHLLGRGARSRRRQDEGRARQGPHRRERLSAARRELRRRRHADRLHGHAAVVPRRLGAGRFELRLRPGRQVHALGASLRRAVAPRLHRLPRHAAVRLRAVVRRQCRGLRRRVRRQAPRRRAQRAA